MFKSRGTVKCGVCREEFSRADNLGRHFKSLICAVCKPLKSLEILTSTLIIKVSRTGVVV